MQVNGTKCRETCKRSRRTRDRAVRRNDRGIGVETSERLARKRVRTSCESARTTVPIRAELDKSTAEGKRLVSLGEDARTGDLSEIRARSEVIPSRPVTTVLRLVNHRLNTWLIFNVRYYI